MVSGRLATRVGTVEVVDTRPHRRYLAGHGARLRRDERGAAVSVAISSVPSHGSGLRFEGGSEGVLLLTSDGMRRSPRSR